MPPQQSDGLLDLFDQSFDFRAHCSSNRLNLVIPGERLKAARPGIHTRHAWPLGHSCHLFEYRECGKPQAR
jgi:hypothetical protein